MKGFRSYGIISYAERMLGMEELVRKLFGGTAYLAHWFEREELVLELESVQKEAECPHCKQKSSRVHSRYKRKFADLPIKGHPTRVILHCRKFFCDNPSCNHKAFTESFDFIKPMESKTERLISEVLKVSGNNSSRKAKAILEEEGIKISKATICNLKNKNC